MLNFAIIVLGVVPQTESDEFSATTLTPENLLPTVELGKNNASTKTGTTHISM